MLIYAQSLSLRFGFGEDIFPYMECFHQHRQITGAFLIRDNRRSSLREIYIISIIQIIKCSLDILFDPLPQGVPNIRIGGRLRIAFRLAEILQGVDGGVGEDVADRLDTGERVGGEVSERAVRALPPVVSAKSAYDYLKEIDNFLQERPIRLREAVGDSRECVGVREDLLRALRHDLRIGDVPQFALPEILILLLLPEPKDLLGQHGGHRLLIHAEFLKEEVGIFFEFFGAEVFDEVDELMRDGIGDESFALHTARVQVDVNASVVRDVIAVLLPALPLCEGGLIHIDVCAEFGECLHEGKSALLPVVQPAEFRIRDLPVDAPVLALVDGIPLDACRRRLLRRGIDRFGLAEVVGGFPHGFRELGGKDARGKLGGIHALRAVPVRVADAEGDGDHALAVRLERVRDQGIRGIGTDTHVGDHGIENRLAFGGKADVRGADALAVLELQDEVAVLT